MVRLAVTTMWKAAGQDSILPVGISAQCCSLVSLGAGTIVVAKGQPVLSRPMALWHHLQRLCKYNSERWARKQQ